MKQVLQNFKTGVVSVEEVPVPAPKSGTLLVRNRASLISAGTEGGTVRLGEMSLLGKARARPEQVKKVIQALKTEGILNTYNAVRRTLEMPIPLGYSCAGVVEAAREGARDIPVGTPVACGGAGFANHAEYVVVPRNLCVPIPEKVHFHEAAFTTVGAIALQGVRTADVRLGEHVVVIGLGLIGLLTAQILKAGGCGVLGIDIDPRKVAWAEEKGICRAVLRKEANIRHRVLDFTGGNGADAVIITAAVESNDPVSLAGEIARHRGRVVVVGRTIMNAPRETYLFKELQLHPSYAYGPGVEDQSYEREGYDYPIGYVRWTVNRNMGCFLELLGERRIDVTPLITHTFPINEASRAFDLLKRDEEWKIGMVLEYGAPDEKDTASKGAGAPVRAMPAAFHGEKVGVGIIGAGSFATNVMLPILTKRRDAAIRRIASSTGIKAASLAKKYGVPYSSSEAAEVIEDPDVDSVFIFTRHGTHAELAEKALLAGKHVFVEKPVALTEDDLRRVAAAQEKTGKVLMIGYNRRFSPLAIEMKRFFSRRSQPLMVEFRGNVGFRPREHWLHDPVDGGGVILGEACHFIDFCCWMVDSPFTHVEARCIGKDNPSLIPEDNAAVFLRFKDGSMAHIIYVSSGARGFSRERCEAHGEGRSAVWEDFRYLRLTKDLSSPKTYRRWLVTKKGYGEEIDLFLKAVRQPDPTSYTWLPGQLDASLAAIKASEEIHGPRGLLSPSS